MVLEKEPTPEVTLLLGAIFFQTIPAAFSSFIWVETVDGQRQNSALIALRSRGSQARLLNLEVH